MAANTGCATSDIREPFQREPDFGATGVNYDFAQLLARGGGAGITWLTDELTLRRALQDNDAVNGG